MDRREFLTQAGFGALSGAALGSTMDLDIIADASADESDAIQNTLRSMIEGAFSNCPKYRIVSICFCGFPPTPCGVKMRMYLPTALIEVFNKPFESIYSQDDGIDADSTRNLNHASHRDESVFEARVWQLLDDFRSTLTFGIADCLWCYDKDVPKSSMGGGGGGRGGGAFGFGGGGGASPDLASALSDATSRFGCALEGDTDQLVADMAQQALGSMELSGFKLVYSSDIDKPSWENGCRDRLTSTILAPITFPVCGGVGVATELGGIAQQLADAMGGEDCDPFARGSANRCENQNRGRGRVRGGGFGSALDFLDDMCVGAWGPHYPRQNRTFGGNDPARAALTAYRALSIAAQIGSFDNVHTEDAKFQTVYPVLEECYDIGDSVAKVGRMTTGSNDGRYGFIYWQPVSCCVTFSRFSSGCQEEGGYG